MQYTDRIWGDQYTKSLELTGTREYLEIITDDGETITLGPSAVHKLWLSLGRYQRAASRATNVR
jgi:hypothetical protein